MLVALPPASVAYIGLTLQQVHGAVKPMWLARKSGEQKSCRAFDFLSEMTFDESKQLQIDCRQTESFVHLKQERPWEGSGVHRCVL